MPALQVLLVILYTAVLGILAILGCLFLPTSGAFMGLARLWSRLTLKTLGVRFVASYTPSLDPRQPCVYMANHQSQLDIPAVVLAMPVDFRMVAKRELLYIPIFGWALWLAGFIFIDQGDRERAIRSLEHAARRIRRGTSIVVFVEGTRSPDGRLLPFKKGPFFLALQSGVPIVPVSVRGGHALMPKGSLKAIPGTIEVLFGEPIETSGYSLETRDSLIEAVRRRIAAGLSGDVPLKST